MKSYVWLTFAFMGWGYYEMSGGADFVPETSDAMVAALEAEVEPKLEVVTRASTPTLLAVSTSNVTTSPAPDDAVVLQAVAEAVAPVEPAAPEVVEVAAPVVEPVVDIRAVAGSRVNMRMGPGTTFDVITTLEGGTELEVLSVNADGWANVSTVDRGIEGWMAERLLTAPNG